MELLKIYHLLLSHFGYQNWWPAETRYEVVIGAVLTQNTSWKNVEKAIENLKKENLIDERKILEIDTEKLKKLIKPAGFYNIKAERLKNITHHIVKNYGSTENLAKLPIKLEDLRKELLNVKGIGKETADSILLYALDRPIFVVDAYTKRIFSRLGVIEGGEEYDEIRHIFEENLPKDLKIYKEYHALIVELGKHYCKKRNPACEKCPLSDLCDYSCLPYK
ncbi:endonuclease III domain-containing protein [Methanotorris igneus]|uniref:HhH-GPD family protein n=1 Tax=Methanotorris igneus (strain DSM 5666 / JCM 11834 / Kol 5) TaxID=880724 RepID=F6BEM7_METIK|nr:endonuclease III domain-containing protein [Methanotorris igneus]AEF96824.1 HhH-GPD family protein [Methanotorris igneus Kol 5]